MLTDGHADPKYLVSCGIHGIYLFYMDAANMSTQLRLAAFSEAVRFAFNNVADFVSLLQFIVIKISMQRLDSIPCRVGVFVCSHSSWINSNIMCNV